MRALNKWIIAFGVLAAGVCHSQNWQYARGSSFYDSLYDAETAIHESDGGGDHALAALILTTLINPPHASRMDYRVAGTFEIGARRPPLPPTSGRLYGLLRSSDNSFYPFIQCGSLPSGWCESEAALRAAWIAYRSSANSGNCSITTNPAPVGNYAAAPTGLTLQSTPLYFGGNEVPEFPISAKLHGGAMDYRDLNSGTRRHWDPVFTCTGFGNPAFTITEQLILVQREHFYCPENWRLNAGGSIFPGSTVATILKDICIASISGLESATMVGDPVGNAKSTNGTPAFDKELIDGGPRDGDPPCDTGNPCSALTGKKSAHEFDFEFSGIEFSRHYDSVYENRDYGSLARGWSHSFSDRILTTHLTAGHGASDCTTAFLQNERGGLDIFAADASSPGRMYSSNNSEEVLTCNSSSEPWTLARGDGSQRIYNSDGYPIAIRYPDAPQRNLTLAWGTELATNSGLVNVEFAPRRLLQVENAVGRALLFDYFSEGDHRLRKITDQAGTTLAEYGYDNLAAPAMPVGVTRPYAMGQLSEARTGSSTRRYQYDYRSLLTKIQEVDATGTIVTDFATYTYDSAGRGATSQHGAGAGLTTFSYSPTTSVVTDSGATATFTGDASPFRRPLTATKGAGSHRRATTFSYHSTTGRLLTRSVRITDSQSSITRNTFTSGWLRPSAIVEADGTLEERTTRYSWNHDRNLPTSISIERCDRPSIGQPCLAVPVVESIERRAYNAQQQLSAVCQVDPASPAAMGYTCGSTQHAPSGVRQTRYAYCASALGTAQCPYAGWLMSVDGPRTDVADITTFEYRSSTPAACTTVPATCPYRKGDLFATLNALGHREEIQSYDTAGRVLRSKDANGILTDYSWHPRGWLLSSTVRADVAGTPSASDAITSTTYERFGKRRRSTGPDGDYIEYCYDAAQRVTAVVLNPGTCNGTATPSGGDAVLYMLRVDGSSEVDRTVDSSGTLFRRLSRQFDNLGLLTSQRDGRDATTGNGLSPADALVPGNGRQVAAYSYDGRGLLLDLQDGRQLLPGIDPLNYNGRSTDRTLDALGRVLAVADAQGLDSVPSNRGVTRFEYDARNHVVHVIDPNNLVTRYTYDGLGNRTRLDSPDTGVTSYVHDAAGNEVGRTDARGVQTLSSYDVLNRLTQTSYASGGVPNPGSDSYAYDLSNTTTGCSSTGKAASFPTGRLSRMTDPSGVTTYCYDLRGNLLSKSQVDSGFSPTATDVIYTYTKADRIASITYPSGARVDYTRNAEGQISSINRVEGGVTTAVVSSATYLPAGPLNTVTFGNAETLTKTYDLNYLPLSTSGPDYSLGYFTDVVGNITRISQITAGGVVQIQRYAYDPVYRLQAVQTNSAAAIEQYSYDKTGNRLSKQFGALAAETYSYNNSPAAPVYPGAPGYGSYSHRLSVISGSGAARTYDANGNATLATASGYGDLYTATDARNREVNQSVLNVTAYGQGMQYNGLGERTTRTSIIDTTGLRSQFYYDQDGQVLGRYDLTFGGGIDSKVARSKSVPATAAYQETIWLDNTPVAVFDKASNGTTQLAFLTTDHLNTPRLARVGTTSVWRWDLVSGNTSTGAKVAAFGEATPQLETLKIDLRFPGQLYDPVTRLHYNYFRTYEPFTGRYTQSDPIGLRGGLSTYGYSLQSPLTVSDPKGLIAWPLAGAVARGIVNFCQRFPAVCFMPPPPPPVGLGSACMLLGNCSFECKYLGECGPPPTVCFDDPPAAGDDGNDGGGHSDGDADGSPDAAPDPGKSNDGRDGRPKTKGLEDQIRLHEEKLKDYKQDPDGHDNKGFLLSASPELRKKIIDARVRELQGQIDNFRRQIEAARGRP